MKNLIIKISLLVYLLLPADLLHSQELKIDVHIDGLSDTTIMLGYHMGESLIPQDTVMADSKGRATFTNPVKLPGGLYFIYIPSEQKIADFLLDKDQVFSIHSDLKNLNENMNVKGNPVNEKFIDYQQALAKKRIQAKHLQKAVNDAESQALKQEAREKLTSLNKEVQTFMRNQAEDNQDNFFGTFIKATREIDVPEPPRDEQGNVKDSAFQYKYYRNHYFDNFDVSDPRLLRTPFYEKKVLSYLEKVIPQVPDTIIHEIDRLIAKTRGNDELFRVMLVTLFNHYAKSNIMGFDAIYIHLAEEYYIPEATWSDSSFIADLKDRVERTKPTLIGNKAPDIELLGIPQQHFITAASDTAAKKDPHAGGFFNLHDVQAKYLVLAFWETDCGHCKKEIPDLYKLYTEELRNKGVKVLAVHMLGGVEGKEKWIDFVNKHELYDWINAWNPYDYKYKVDYDLYSTPVVFLMDHEKKIIAKRVSVDQLKDIIEMHEKQNEEQ